MASVESGYATALRYPRRSLKRAERAFRCSSFRLDLLADMRSQSISIRQVSGPAGVKSRYSRRNLAELQAENEMMWLIAVGILRREVDGQGLTDSFRLTPMGRQVFEHLSPLSPTQYRPTLGDHLYNAWCRWVRWPY
ncbi:hypothetical protein H6F75_19330 [Nodosilinea sp. FACHB-131]|uniref:Npun_F0494 family protein n=1 Tax=Cyanophyceae TaxID=3028117 RepID=UPI00168692D1|nr:Npun_F0494 family protein [Nodosilinea sp. FACHB-131]MBD1875638.1 hypothetical protein [Nodosilinea sp. FACHB-131]